jgi:hypothetical protein
MNAVNEFFRKVKRLKAALEKQTGFNRPRDNWPFGWSAECNPEDCFKRPDGLWQQKKRINTHMTEEGASEPGHVKIFLWRVKPNYCTAGRPCFDANKKAAFLQESETTKVILTRDGYEWVWRWETVQLPTENVWGMKMGEAFFEVRKVGEDYGERSKTMAGLKRKMSTLLNVQRSVDVA